MLFKILSVPVKAPFRSHLHWIELISSFTRPIIPVWCPLSGFPVWNHLSRGRHSASAPKFDRIDTFNRIFFPCCENCALNLLFAASPGRKGFLILSGCCFSTREEGDRDVDLWISKLRRCRDRSVSVILLSFLLTDIQNQDRSTRGHLNDFVRPVPFYFYFQWSRCQLFWSSVTR